MKALVFEQFGEPDVLHMHELPEPVTLENEVLVKMKTVGLNFADVYRRKGNYHLVGNPPFILGYEGAGIVESVGPNVHTLKVGDRIAFADVPLANAEFVSVPVDKAIPLPEEISFDTAASVLLQGLTAQYLTRDSYRIQTGDIALVHSAAGGVGQLLVQIIQLLGGKVIGLTSSSEKGEIVKGLGATECLLYSDNWKEKVLHMTKGLGVDVAFESVGSTIMDSFESVRTGGTVVFFGMAGGDPVSIDPRMLMDTSKTLTGGDLWNVLTSHEERIQRSNELFSWISQEKLSLSPPTTFPLEQGADAHRFLESRKSTGKILLTI
ncbi:quinone oxidoreductase family protein [Bacillus sp. 2205SS5-2]|uniref:quinone oxidoreductase family protein n=1 Tax=Bacillus sp. 2205SS5-2 TaxID=3109031 RepID=UPI003005F35B